MINNSSNKVTRGHGVLENTLAKMRAKKANQLIKPKYRKGNLLDIGCGSFPFFLHTTKFKNKYGVDPSLQNLKFENIKLSKIDIAKNKLLFKDNFFDTVTMLAVFEHIEKDRLNSALKEIFRTLKKDGILVITTPSPWSDKLLHQMAKFGLISSEEIHDHKSHYSKENIVDIMSKAGFSKNLIKRGYFEFGFNMWFKAQK